MDDFTRGNGLPDDPEPDWDTPPSHDSCHLLIALFPNRDVQRAIEEHRKNWLWPKSSYFPSSSRMHLTLHCIANQSDPVLKRLHEALSEVPVHPLALLLNSSRTWKNDIAVMQPAEHEGLRALHRHISNAVSQTGIVTRPTRLTPHITIARKTTGATYPRDLAPIPWTARNFLLVRSHTSHPVRHEVLASYGPKEDDGV